MIGILLLVGREAEPRDRMSRRGYRMTMEFLSNQAILFCLGSFVTRVPQEGVPQGVDEGESSFSGTAPTSKRV
jgi:hypothetical protein